MTPALADEWEFSEDGKEITLTIKQGVKFHNGDVLTTEDVAYSLNRAIDSSYTSKFTAVMESAEVIDETHVKLVLKDTYGPILYCLANPSISIVSKKAVEAAGDTFGTNPIGTGPYKYVDWISGERVVLTRFDYYFKGPSPIKDVNFRFITDTSSAAVALESGEIYKTFSQSAKKEHKQAQVDNSLTRIL